MTSGYKLFTRSREGATRRGVAPSGEVERPVIPIVHGYHGFAMAYTEPVTAERRDSLECMNKKGPLPYGTALCSLASMKTRLLASIDNKEPQAGF